MFYFKIVLITSQSCQDYKRIYALSLYYQILAVVSSFISRYLIKMIFSILQWNHLLNYWIDSWSQLCLVFLVLKIYWHYIWKFLKCQGPFFDKSKTECSSKNRRPKFSSYCPNEPKPIIITFLYFLMAQAHMRSPLGN